MLESLTIQKGDGHPFVGIAVGSGLAAKHAVAGGADFLLALNAGRFRHAGANSPAALLPFANSNEMVMSFGVSEILTRAGNKPVFFGACATDVTVTHADLIRRIIDSGFGGVNNFPSVGLIDGQYREALEENGLGFEREVDFLRLAKQAGLATLAFVFNEREAESMAAAGVDVICAHLGFTESWNAVRREAVDEDAIIRWVNGIFAASDSVAGKRIKMVYGGGPVTSPEAMDRIYQKTDAVGYIGGSSLEKNPAAQAIEGAVGQFKQFKVLKEENEALRRELQKKKGFDEIVGVSGAMRELFEIINKVADKDINVLMSGESGTGKELVVKALHFNSPRKDHPFIKVNCAAIPDSLLESELFGHEKGAFTGATQQRMGYFELANHGTLFLDEVGELPSTVQAKLLRAIQQREISRLGSENTIHVDIRLICATNADLRAKVEAGLFREDLYYRLNVICIRTPPLKQHKEDLPLLINHFLGATAEQLRQPKCTASPEALDLLLKWDWPGNVRELRNTVESACVLCTDNRIMPKDLPLHMHPVSPDDAVSASARLRRQLSSSAEEVEKRTIAEALAQCQGRRGKAAELLGITRRTLYNKMMRYGLPAKSKNDM